MWLIVQSALKCFHMCVHVYTVDLQNKNMFNILCTESFIVPLLILVATITSLWQEKKYFSLHITVLFMQGNASYVGCFCVERGICSAGLEPGHRHGARVGLGEHGTVPIRLTLPKCCEFKSKSGAMPEPCFLGPGILYSSHISVGEVKRVPSLPLSSRTLSGARQFPMEDRWQLPLGSSGSQASDSSAVGNSCQLLWCDIPQTPGVSDTMPVRKKDWPGTL